MKDEKEREEEVIISERRKESSRTQLCNPLWKRIFHWLNPHKVMIEWRLEYIPAKKFHTKYIFFWWVHSLRLSWPWPYLTNIFYLSPVNITKQQQDIALSLQCWRDWHIFTVGQNNLQSKVVFSIRSERAFLMLLPFWTKPTIHNNWKETNQKNVKAVPAVSKGNHASVLCLCWLGTHTGISCCSVHYFNYLPPSYVTFKLISKSTYLTHNCFPRLF